MKNLLKQHFGYSEFRPLQEEIINNVLERKDTFVLMPTGGGKSLCFQLPALKFEGVTLVISPLIALMKDQVDALKANGIKAEFINSSLDIDEVSKIKKRVKSGEVKILYIAPERLVLNSFQNYLKTVKVDLIAIDEAHCISEWGHDFRTDYRNLSNLKNLFPKIPIIALTATATPKVQKDILEQLHLKNPKTFVSSFQRENLALSVINKKDAYFKLLDLVKKYKGQSVIIYCFSRNDTENLCAKLKIDGFKALPYHAGISNEKRKQNQNLFINDEVDIIVATIAFGMGIDKPDVRLVVHYTYPKSLEAYYQEIGRAGRDSLPSECVLFFTYADTIKHRFFLDQTEDFQEKAKNERKLREVMNYAETKTCRTKYLLKYFGETLKSDCGVCDICTKLEEMFDATEIVQKILSTVFKTGNRFGFAHIIKVMRGSKDKRVLQFKHNKLSVYGIEKEYSADSLKHFILSLIAKNLLVKTEGEYPVIKITEKGISFLKNKEKIKLSKPEKEYFATQKISKDNLDYNLELFEELRVLRKNIANKKGVPPFIIFGDLSLRQMAYYFPQNKQDLALISGMGAKKLEKFGDQFLEKICAFVFKNNILAKKIPQFSKKPYEKVKVNKTNIKYEKTREMIQKKMSLAKIAEENGFTKDTIISHIKKLIESGEDLNIEYLKPPLPKFEEIMKSFAKCGDERLKPVYKDLEEKYSYDDIKLVSLFFLSK